MRLWRFFLAAALLSACGEESPVAKDPLVFVTERPSLEAPAEAGAVGLSLIRASETGAAIGTGWVALTDAGYEARLLFPPPVDNPTADPGLCTGALRDTLREDRGDNPPEVAGPLRCVFGVNVAEFPITIDLQTQDVEIQGGSIRVSGVFAEGDPAFDEDGALILGGEAFMLAAHRIVTVAPIVLVPRETAPRSVTIMKMGPEARLGVIAHDPEKAKAAGYEGFASVFFPFLNWVAYTDPQNINPQD